MGSVRAIAKQIGVSPATVSRAINNDPRVTVEMRERVISAMNKSRYVPTLGRRSTTNVALAYTGESSLGSPFDAALMLGMSPRMDEYGFDLVILNVSRARLPRETLSQMFVRKGIRGAVLRSDARTRQICEELADEGFPSIVVGDRFDNPRVSYIYSDSRKASREAVEHLIGLGHCRIAFSLNIVDDSDHTDRLAGWREALEAHGMDADDRLCLRTPAERQGGAQLLRRLAAMADPPTAIYIADPLAAVGCIIEAQKSGMKIPGDLSVVGFDDSDVAGIVYPQMTAVRQDAAAIGREAFDALHTMLKNDAPAPPVRMALNTWLEVHDSTGPANRAAPVRQTD